MSRIKGSRNLPRFCQTKPEDRQLKELEILASIGYSKEWIAEEFGVSFIEFQNWLVRYSEVFEAWRRGVGYRRKRALRCAFETAFPLHECTEKCPPNCHKKGRPEKGDTAMAIFLLKSQFGLSEKSQVEVAGSIVIQSQIGNDGTLSREIISVEDVRSCIEAEVVKKTDKELADA